MPCLFLAVPAPPDAVPLSVYLPSNCIVWHSSLGLVRTAVFRILLSFCGIFSYSVFLACHSALAAAISRSCQRFLLFPLGSRYVSAPPSVFPASLKVLLYALKHISLPGLFRQRKQHIVPPPHSFAFKLPASVTQCGELARFRH